MVLLMYYFNNPPLIGLEYSMPSEGNYLIVSKNLIEAVALFVLAVFLCYYGTEVESLRYVSGLLLITIF